MWQPPSSASSKSVKATAACIAIAASAALSPCTLAAEGLIAISELFAIKRLSGSTLFVKKWEGSELFVRVPGHEPQYLGFTEGGPPSGMGPLEAATSDLRAVTLAVSKDGRSLVFRHSARKARAKTKLEPGIYQYVDGQGLKLLHPEKDLSGNTYTRREQELPPDILPFQYKCEYTPKCLLWGLRATGEEFPLGLLDGTPLHSAAFDGRTEDCARLIREGADPNATTYWGFTALDLAIIRDHEETAIQLLVLGAEPNSGRYPALHRAVMLGRMKVVQAMLAHGVDVNGADDRGYTPLHLAVFAGSRLVGGVNEFFAYAETTKSISDRNVTTPLVRMLLEKGANPALRDKYGKTALGSVGRGTPLEAKELLQAASPAESDSCDEALLYETADAHPAVKWISPRRGASGDAALGCILRSAGDDGTLEAKAYMSSGLYRFLRECKPEEDKVYRLFEYKEKARPYLLRLHTQPLVEPRTYIVVGSRRSPVGSYLHSIDQKSNDASSMTLCPPDAQPRDRPERPTAAPLGSRRASRVGARLCPALGLNDTKEV